MAGIACMNSLIWEVAKCRCSASLLSHSSTNTNSFCYLGVLVEAVADAPSLLARRCRDRVSDPDKRVALIRIGLNPSNDNDHRDLPSIRWHARRAG